MADENEPKLSKEERQAKKAERQAKRAEKEAKLAALTPAQRVKREQRQANRKAMEKDKG